MITTRTVKTEFSSIPMRKLMDLEKQGWVINGVHIQRMQEDGAIDHGAVTTGGLVLWWHSEQDRVILPSVRSVAQHALDVLKEIHPGNMTPMAEVNWNKAINILSGALASPQNQLDDIDVVDMAAFEAAMRYQGFFQPQRASGITAKSEYISGRDQDRYAGWKMAMEANGDERELCARACEALPAPGSCNAIERSLWDVAAKDCAAAIRARGEK